ncbi:MAG: hypothetical protein HRT35_25320 [Algicola sp.]|nr:hypothetical protein [Algicola sp.]
MANITVRNLSDQTKETLRMQAEQSALSLENHTRHLLQVAAEQPAVKAVDILTLAQHYFGPNGGVELDSPARGTKRQ